LVNQFPINSLEKGGIEMTTFFNEAIQAFAKKLTVKKQNIKVL